ncbi:hypothetical protein [Pseudomonas sp. LFM046]|uniref:hypothetical protein n=1 Tax=Pseudomonas sp. LFM046 TaxID=1608357 RepID=UPI0005CFE2DC|nr:hypothetical protein [Pseudomonas sp. LFM046]
MLDALMMLLLISALVACPIFLIWRENQLRWWARYVLSLMPVAYTWIGWRLGVLAYDHFGCQGGAKNVHACYANGIDVTALVGHGMFLMIPFIFFAAPMSLWFLLNTGAKHIGQRN